MGALKDGKITAWKRISAEEASKVLVQALVAGDLGMLETVLATADELAKLGVPKGEVDQVSAAAGQRFEQANTLIKALGATGWNRDFVWNRLDGMLPHMIPADADTGLAQDLTLYEKKLRGSLFGSSNPRFDIPRVLSQYMKGHVDLDGLITQEYKLDEINQGYQDMRDGKNLRGLIRY